MDLHHNIWLILLLSLPSQDIILGPGMQLCWCQPKDGAYPHLVTKPFSRLLRNCGTVLRRKSETFRPSHLLNKLSKHTFLRELLIDLFIHIAFNWLIDFILIVCYAHMKIFLLYMRNISFIFIVIIIIVCLQHRLRPLSCQKRFSNGTRKPRKKSILHSFSVPQQFVFNWFNGKHQISWGAPGK